jgi:type VI secretion system Hcp family effector
MADTVHLLIKDKKKGSNIAGETSQTGVESLKDMIECYYVEHNVTTPWESGNAVAIASRQHEPVLVRKRVDKATPHLLEAMKHSAKLECEFFFHRPARDSDGDHRWFGIKLDNAQIVSLRVIVPEADDEPVMEELKFAYTDISYSIFEEAGGAIVGTDSWVGTGRTTS